MRTVQNSFVSGELSPALHGRHDLKAYFNGAAGICNWIVRKAGGLRKRAGTDVLMDLTGFPGCRLIPFYFDRTTCFLLMFHGQKMYIIGKDTAGKYDFLKRYIGDPGGGSYYTFALDDDWEIVTVTTAYADADLPKLKAYQAGDTVYLTCPSYQACQVKRMANLSWELEYMTGTISAPQPGPLTATPSGFSGGTATTAEYALFAMRSGVASLPSKASAAIESPWTAGAKVALSFVPDFTDGIDGYHIGKKTGAYYGLLAELYPTREAVSLTGKTYSSSGVPTTGWAAGYKLSADHATDLAATDPNAKESLDLKLTVNKYAFHVPIGTDGYARAQLYFYSYGWLVDAGAFRIYSGARTFTAARQDVSAPDYVEFRPNVLVEYGSALDGVWHPAFSGALPFPASGKDYSEIPISATDTAYWWRISFSGFGANDTGIVLRGIAQMSRAGAYVTNRAVLFEGGDDTLYVSGGVSGRTDSATKYLAADLAVMSDIEAALRDDLVEVSCQPARYVQPHKTPVALTLYTSGTGEKSGYVKLTSGSVFSVKEIRIWPGFLAAALPLSVPGSVGSFTSNTAGCRILYTLGGGTWLKLATLFPLPDQYADGPVSILVPADTAPEITGAAVGWGVELVAHDQALPVRIRGVQFCVTTVPSSFTDENHTPGALIDAQTNISPGDSAMAVDVLTVWQQRMILAASSGLPFALWASTVGNFENWYANRPMTDADAFSVSIPATRASKIMHLLSDRSLAVFTESGVYTVKGSESEGFSYRTCRIERACATGCCGVDPLAVLSSMLFVADDGRTLTELKYDLAQDGIVPIDRSVLSAHLTETANAVRMAWQSAPDGTLWLLLTDGTLLGFTYLPEHEVYAWTRHAFEGEVIDVVAPGTLEETADREGSGDAFLLVSAGGKVTLERMRAAVASDAPAIEAALCLDRLQVVFSVVATNEFWPSVAYPAGDVLTAVDLATGEVRTATSATTGPAIVTLAGAAASGRWALGYPVTAVLETLRPELPDRNVQGIAKNVTDILMRVRRARGMAVRSTGGGLADTYAPEGVAIAGGRVGLYSGDWKVAPYGYINTHGGITVTAAGPWPAELLSLVQSVQTGEG